MLADEGAERIGPDPEVRAAASRIVGIGASAGGIEALERLFSCLPATPGLAFIVVQHLDPERESLLPELIGRASRMPVEKARDRAIVLQDHVYVAPPNVALSVEHGVIRLETPLPPHGRRDTIDHFLRSLAEDQGSSAIGIVLSGTGMDGTEGLRALKESGAFAMVQDPKDAKFEGMPQSAIDAGQADAILSIEDMAAALLERASRPASASATKAREPLRSDSDFTRRILSLLRERTGRDYGHYKHSTLKRRIQHRMQIAEIDDLAHYVEVLEADPKAIDTLAADLLISVTQFFRDTEAFEALDKLVLPELVERRHEKPAGGLRVWVPGCATGEEAYSIAILISEHTRRLSCSFPVQVFATDIDEDALDVARRGNYPETIAEHVTPERLARHFTKTEAGYRISKEVRASCVFSVHDILADPPFSRLDLVSCRNVLIYFDAEAQRKLLPVLHYALRPGGVLFLGPSENVTAHADLFRPIDKKSRLFERKEVRSTRGIIMPVSPRPAANPRWIDRAAPVAVPRSGRQQLGDELRRILIDEYGPGAALVTEQGELVHLAGRTSALLELPLGPFENNVLAMARGPLRVELRTALNKAARSREIVTVEGIPLQQGERAFEATLLVRPIAQPGAEAPLFLVVFREERSTRVAGAAEATEKGGMVPGALVHELEAEVRRTKEDLQATIMALEASNDELKSSNEELMSMNEELQSANEEMQTSKEELQSVNEELQTVNAELGKKIEELNRTNDDLQNLLRSTQIATLFLDSDLRIKRYTPATVELFRLIEGDLGRPITDISAPFADAGWLDDVREVLRTLAPRERPLRAFEGRAWYMMIVLPYRTLTNVIDGVVVTFINVTELKQAQLRAAELSAIVESSQDAIVGQTMDGTITSWNRGAEVLFGYTADEMVGKNFAALTPDELASEVAALRPYAVAAEMGKPIETVRLRKGGGRVSVSLAFSPRRDDEGRAVGVAVIARDVTSRRQAEDEARRLREELERSLTDIRTILDVVPVGILIAHDREASRVTGNAACAELLGVTEATNLAMTEPSITSLPFRVLRGGEDVAPSERALARAAGHGEVVQGEAYDVVFRDGAIKHTVISAVPLLDAQGKSRGAVGVLVDVTAQRRATMELEQTSRHKDEFMAMLGHELRNPLAAMTGAYALLERGAQQEEQKGRAMAVLGRQLRHLERLVDDLLDISRVSRGKIELRREKLDFTELVRQAVDDQQAAYQAAGIELHFDGGPGPLRVLGDRVRLSQVVSNLLSNGLKFTGKGGVVEASLRRSGGVAELRVVDTGIGIESAALGSIFEPFVQAGAPIARGAGGLGLGLAVCKRIIEMHGGTIEAQSEGLGHGATLLTKLPLVSDLARGDAAVVKEDGSTSQRILIIEDSEDIAVVIGAILEGFGHVVEIAFDGQTGLDAAARFRPDVVLCDIGLPGGMDGYAVARALRNDPAQRGVYLVALTGYARSLDRLRAREAGFDVHVRKPVDADGLSRLMAGARRA